MVLGMEPRILHVGSKPLYPLSYIPSLGSCKISFLFKVTNFINLKIFYKDSDCFCQKKKESKGIQQMVREKEAVIHSGRLGTAAMEL